MRTAAPHGCQGHRHRLAGQALGHGEAGVARNHHTLAIDQDRHGPAELRNRARDLLDLARRMLARVARIGAQARERADLDLEAIAVWHGAQDSL